MQPKTRQELENDERIAAFEREVEKQKNKPDPDRPVVVKQTVVAPVVPQPADKTRTPEPPRLLAPVWSVEYVQFLKMADGAVAIKMDRQFIEGIQFTPSLRRMIGFEHDCFGASEFRATFAPSTNFDISAVFCMCPLIEDQILNGRCCKLLGVLPISTFDSEMDISIPNPHYLRVVGWTRLVELYIELRSVYGKPVALPIGRWLFTLTLRSRQDG